MRDAWDAWARDHPTVTFVQIGAHDGVDRGGEDPIAPYIDRHPGWVGVLVEPIPEYFDALERLRGADRRLRLVRAAVTTFDGMVTMHTVETRDTMPSWADRLSSIDPGVVLSHAGEVPDLESSIREITVPAVTYARLTRDMDRIDVLVTDTEGHDARILDQVDLRTSPPSVILYESLHLSDREFLRCERRLRRAGYRLATDEGDTIAIR